VSARLTSGSALALGGVPLDRAFAALKKLEPHAHACWVYDLDEFAARARRFREGVAALDARVALALKANPLPALLECARAQGLAAEAGSLGELTLARAAGFGARARVLNGNGRTREEAAWAAREGVHSVNADSIEELDLLERAAAEAGRTLRVALRVNPGIVTPGHRYVATGGEDAKFGVDPDDALAAWQARARWAHLTLDGVHVHVGSQVVDPAPLEGAAAVALRLIEESARRGAPLTLLNLGGGMGVDYVGGNAEFPLEAYAARLVARAPQMRVEWVFEPGRWMTAPIGVLLCEVLWVKRRRAPGGAAPRRFVVLVGEIASDQVAPRPALVPGPHHRLRQSIPGGDPLRNRSPDFDHALARAEVLSERHLVDVVVPVGERDDVRDLAAAPLVDRLIVVADDAEVRAKLRQPPDKTLLQRVDILVLVDHDVADVVTDVTADRSRVLVVILVSLEELRGEVDQFRVVEVGLLVDQPHVIAERRLDSLRDEIPVDRVLAEHARRLKEES